MTDAYYPSSDAEVAVIDQEARRLADKALGKIEGHELLCTERWEQARSALGDLAKEMNSAKKWLISLLITLLGSVALLFANGTIRLH